MPPRRPRRAVRPARDAAAAAVEPAVLVIGAPIAAIAVFAAVIIAVHLRRARAARSHADISNLQFVSNAKAEFAGIPSKANVVGYANAPVTIQEFGDLRCPVCREFDSTVIPDVLTKLVRTHKAKIMYTHWPILGDNSVYANRAAYAAEQQNKLWEYALVVYYNQGDENVNWFTKAFARAVACVDRPRPYEVRQGLRQHERLDRADRERQRRAPTRTSSRARPRCSSRAPKTTDDLERRRRRPTPTSRRPSPRPPPA